MVVPGELVAAVESEEHAVTASAGVTNSVTVGTR